MWFDEPRIQLTLEKVMEKVNQIDPQYAAGEFEGNSPIDFICSIR